MTTMSTPQRPAEPVETTKIEEEFVILEDKIPNLKNLSTSKDTPQWSETMDFLMTLCKGVLLWSFVTTIIFLPIGMAMYEGRLVVEELYSLSTIPVGESSDWLNFFRITLLLATVSTFIIFTYYSSILVPKAIAAFSKKGRKVLNSTLIHFLELLMTSWRYFCYNFCLTLIWLLTVLILPYDSELFGGSWTEIPKEFYVERIMLILCLYSYLLTVEKSILHFLAKEFNKSLYRDRIQKSLFSLWSIDVLRKAASIFEYRNITDDTTNLKKKWKCKPFPYYTTDVTSVFLLEHFVQLGKKVGDKKVALARRLHHFLSPNPKEGFKINDISHFFPREEVENVFSVFSNSVTGQVTEADFVNAIDHIYQERVDLIQVLSTNTEIVSQLDTLMHVVVGILVYFSIFSIIGFSPSDALVPLGVSLAPTIVTCTLIFGETIKSLVAAIVFMFATHPYDVGDRVYLDKSNFFVRKMGLLSTTFERFDGFIVYYPNSVLANKEILNVRRTGNQAQRIEVSLPAKTSTTVVQELESRLLRFVNTELRDFYSVGFTNYELRDNNQLVVVITLKHRHNFQDGPARVLRNNSFMSFLINAINELGIEYLSTVRTVEFTQ